MSFDYEAARAEGYSDAEILNFLSEKNPNLAKRSQQALSQGYQPEEIVSHLEKQETAKRMFGMGATRAAETVLGAPRAAGEFAEMLIPEKAIKKAAGALGVEKQAEKGLETFKKYAPYKVFPSSEQIHQNVTKTIFGDRFEPKTETEKRISDTISDFAALAIPLPGQKFKILKPFLLSIGGNAAAETAKGLGAEEKGQAYTKLGTFLVGGMINPKGLENLKNDLYSKAREARPEDATVSSVPLKREIEKSRVELTKGGTPDSAKPALKLLDDLEGSIQGDQVPIDALERHRQNINEERAGLYKKLEGNKPGIKRASAAVDEVAKINKNALELYGKQNPDWAKSYFPANEVHSAIAQSKKVRNAVLKHSKKIMAATGGLFGLEMAGLIQPASMAGIGGAAAAGAPLLVGSEIAARALKSPTIRKYYGNVVKSALKDDALAVASNLTKLDEEMKKQEE